MREIGATLTLWDLPDGLLLGEIELPDHTSSMTRIALSPDGRLLAHGTGDVLARPDRILLQDLESGPTRTLGPSKLPLLRLLFSRDGSVVFAEEGLHGKDGSLEKMMVGAWVVSTGKKLSELETPIAPIVIGSKPDELYQLRGDHIVRYDLGLGQAIETINIAPGTGETVALAFSRDGMRAVSLHRSAVATGRTHKMVLAYWNWAARTIESTVVVDAGGEQVNGMLWLRGDAAISPDGKYASVSTDQGSVQLLKWGETRPHLEQQADPHRDDVLGFTADSTRVMIGTSVWDTETGELIVSGPPVLPKVATTVVKGTRVFSLQGNDLTAWDIDSLRRNWHVPGVHDGKADSARLVVSKEGSSLLVFDKTPWSGDGASLVVLESTTGRVLKRQTLEGRIHAAGFTEEGDIWVVGEVASQHYRGLWPVADVTMVRSILRNSDAPDAKLQFPQFSPDGRWIVGQAENCSGSAAPICTSRGELRNLESGTVRSFALPTAHLGKYSQFAYSRFAWTADGFATGTQGKSGTQGVVLQFFKTPQDTGSGAPLTPFAKRDLGKDMLVGLSTTTDGQTIAATVTADGRSWREGRVILLDAGSGEIVGDFPRLSRLRDLTVSDDRQWAVAGLGAMTVLENLRRNVFVRMFSVGSEWIITDDSGLFAASGGGATLLAAAQGLNGFRVDQLALRNNDPARLMRSMGVGSNDQLAYYDSQYRRRLRRTGVTEDTVDDLFRDPPTAQFVRVSREGAMAHLEFELAAPRGLLRYNIDVNGVPLFGAAGKPIQGKQSRLTQEVKLGAGINRIELRVFDLAGIESLRPVRVVPGPEPAKRDLYFLGFGVSKYANPEYNLQFARKDVLDLAEVLRAAEGKAFDTVHTRVYVDQAVTTSAIKQARDFLSKARVDDVVILMVAGHGIHSEGKDAQYYFATHEARLDALADTAAPFDVIEALLDGIDSRHKLFLMDTCESGERDEELQELTSVAGAGSRGLRPRAARALTRTHTAQAEPTTTKAYVLEQDRFLFNALFRRSGAVVLSSSSGVQYSYESEKLQNGVYTQALLEALTGSEADKDGDGFLTSLELRDSVTNRVSSFTEGKQTPTVDRDNLSANFRFPVTVEARDIVDRGETDLPSYATDGPPRDATALAPPTAPAPGVTSRRGCGCGAGSQGNAPTPVGLALLIGCLWRRRLASRRES